MILLPVTSACRRILPVSFLHRGTIILLVVPLLLIAGCVGQANPTAAAVKTGDTISVYYTLVVDGSTVDSNVGKQLFTFTVGSGQVIPGFDSGVLGMKAGEEKTFTVSPEQGYGTSGSSPLAGKTLIFTVKVASINPA
ncbi:MAG: FKBP-type peptidyl-prolyl cis-trans isomerase [Candidatus Aenigmatarchaeota archaeon]